MRNTTETLPYRNVYERAKEFFLQAIKSANILGGTDTIIHSKHLDRLVYQSFGKDVSQYSGFFGGEKGGLRILTLARYLQDYFQYEELPYKVDVFESPPIPGTIIGIHMCTIKDPPHCEFNRHPKLHS